MPTPEPRETKEEFIERCIPIVIEEGKTPEEATAICHSYWESKEAMRKVAEIKKLIQDNE